MKPPIVALHGFLGKGGDWDAVRAAAKSDLHWICPDLFAPGATSFAPPEVAGPCWLAGYSFGARLALRWMQNEPHKWRGALLISVNPGNFQSDDARRARRMADEMWASHFRKRPWDEVVSEWNAQKIFANDQAVRRAEMDFDRERLALAVEKFSVADYFTDPLRLPSNLVWLAGTRDGKFVRLQQSMSNAGFPGTFLSIEGAGHRLLHDAPNAIAAALDNLVARQLHPA